MHREYLVQIPHNSLKKGLETQEISHLLIFEKINF